MPVHDWTRVDAGVFHDFHQSWIISIRNALNADLLPEDYYALAEQVTGGPIPDVVTLQRLTEANDQIQAERGAQARATDGGGGLAVIETPPKMRFNHSAELDVYSRRATRVTVRHVTGDRVVAFIEIVSPGNKQSTGALEAFVDKLAAGIRSGCHLLVIDLHPPTPRDPRGVHAYFWEHRFGDPTAPGVDAQQPLGMSAYCSGMLPTAYFEPFAVGDELIDMPIFLTPDIYVNVPLEQAYLEAWQGVPRRWKQVIQPPG